MTPHLRTERATLAAVRFVLALVIVLTTFAVAPGALAAPAQDDDAPVEITEAEEQQPGGIIPRPNSGAPPEDPGDRGGAYQWLLFGLIIVFIAVAVLSIRRSAKRAQANRAAVVADAGRPDDTSDDGATRTS